jgi:hypothetical protein
MNLLKYLRSGDVNGIVTLGGAWLVGIAVVFLASAAKVTQGWDLNGVALVDWDWATKVMIGVQATSLFAVLPFDFKKAFDKSDSAKTPQLLTGVYGDDVDHASTYEVSGDSNTAIPGVEYKDDVSAARANWPNNPSA